LAQIKLQNQMKKKVTGNPKNHTSQDLKTFPAAILPAPEILPRHTENNNPNFATED
jgi:hypothetical protein